MTSAVADVAADGVVAVIVMLGSRIVQDDGETAPREVTTMLLTMKEVTISRTIGATATHKEVEANFAPMDVQADGSNVVVVTMDSIVVAIEGVSAEDEKNFVAEDTEVGITKDSEGVAEVTAAEDEAVTSWMVSLIMLAKGIARKLSRDSSSSALY